MLENPLDTFTVAAKLGRDQEVSDEEFFYFADGNFDVFTEQRRHELERLFREEPWRSELEREQVHLALAKAEAAEHPTSVDDATWKSMEAAFDGAASETGNEASNNRDVLEKNRPWWRGIRRPGFRVAFAATAATAAILIAVLFIARQGDSLPTDVHTLAQIGQESLNRVDEWFSPTRNVGSGVRIISPSSQVVNSLQPTLSWRLTVPDVRVERVSLYEGKQTDSVPVDSVTAPNRDQWLPRTSLKTQTLYTWRIDYEVGEIGQSVTARFATPSETAIRYLSGDDSLTRLQTAIVLIELERYEESIRLMNDMVNDPALKPSERSEIETLIGMVRARGGTRGEDAQTQD